MRLFRRCLPGFLLTAMLVLANCGGDVVQNTNTGPDEAGEVPNPAPIVVNVSIPAGATGLGAQAYGTNPLIISINTTVTWVNNDDVDHTVTSVTGLFDSGVLSPGQSFSFTFSQPGTFQYFCSLHGAESMSGTIVVTEDEVPVSPTPPPTASPSPDPTVSPSPTVSPTSAPTEGAILKLEIPEGTTGLQDPVFGESPTDVQLGTTVTWVNEDSVAHSITADDLSFDSGTINPGDSFSYTFNDLGTFSYHCKLHENESLRGSIRVVS